MCVRAWTLATAFVLASTSTVLVGSLSPTECLEEAGSPINKALHMCERKEVTSPFTCVHMCAGVQMCVYVSACMCGHVHHRYLSATTMKRLNLTQSTTWGSARLSLKNAFSISNNSEGCCFDLPLRSLYVDCIAAIYLPEFCCEDTYK